MTKFAAFRARLFVGAKNAVMRRRLHHASLVSVTDLALFATHVFRSGDGQDRGSYWRRFVCTVLTRGCSRGGNDR